MAGSKGVADQQVRIGKHSYTLRYSVKALAALQDHWGLQSFAEVGERLSSIGTGMNADDLVGILWAGLRTHHPDIDKEAVLDLIDDAGMDGLVDAMTAAITGGLPSAESGEGQGTSEARPRTKPRKTGR